MEAKVCLEEEIDRKKENSENEGAHECHSVRLPACLGYHLQYQEERTSRCLPI